MRRHHCHSTKSILASAVVLTTLAFSSNAFAEGPSSWSSESDWDIPGEYVVDFEDDTEASDIKSVMSRLGLAYRDSRLASQTRIEIVTITKNVAATIAKLRGTGDIENIEPHAKVRMMWTPNDPMYDKQWHMPRVGSEAAWQTSIGRGVTVAVIDTGIACENFKEFTKASDLNQTRCVEGFNFVKKGTHANDDQGHGTHVAGTIAQSTDNGVGAVGLAFGARLMPVKVLSSNGFGTTTGVADGIRWAADNGAQVLNLSLGGPRNSKVLQSAVDYARSKGCIIVAAAGNSGGKVGYPGGSDGVIGVSATDENNSLAWFSSRGEGVDIAAPGVNVTQQTICDKGRNRCEIFPAYNGTSMASPHVAGAAALLVGLGVTDADAVERILTEHAKVLDDSPDGRKKFGAGLLQAHTALEAVHREQVIARLVALLSMALLAFAWARRRGETISKASPSFWLAGLTTGVGALFFAPWVMSRHVAAVDWLSRPVGDWSILLGVDLHQLLPFAHIGVPLALIAVLYKVKGAAGLLGGVAVGTAAYLLSTMWLGYLTTPFGYTLTMAWCALNAFGCMYLSSLVLTRERG
jgi:serine protease